MQTTVPTRPASATALREALARVGPPALLAGLLLVSAAIVLPQSDVPIFDQQVFLRARFDAKHLPSPAKGLTAELWVAAVRLVHDGKLAELDPVLKGLAMLAYCGAATWLASAWLRRRSLLAVFILLIFASQYPFLWISSELFAGAYLCLALLAWHRRAPPWLTGGLLAVFALAKPDLVLMAGALAAFWAWRETGRARALLIGGFAGGYVLLLLPGLAVQGLAHFHTWDQSEGRAFMGFADHFKRTLVHFQVAGPAPEPLEAYTRPFFGDATSMWQVWTHPQGWFVYLEFVLLATLRGVVKIVYLFNWGLLALAALLLAYRRAGRRLDAHERSLLVCCVGFVPLVLFTYPHFRYMARFFPLFLLLVLGACERAEALRGTRVRGPALAVAAASLAAMLATLGGRALYNLSNIAHLDHYWFPD